jgi:peptidoglycan/LPS O-acetylase OafA/YrhL
VPDLTCCRAVFALWVFAYHQSIQLGARPPLLARGHLGVDGFFILSGIVLALAHPSLGLGRGAVAGFWVRRLQRVYPVHLAALALLMLLLAASAAAGLSPRDPGRFGGHELMLNLFLLHGWGFSDRWAWNYPSWSVSTEWFGYLLFPLAWVLVRRLSAARAAVLAAAALGALQLVQLGSGSGLNLTYDGALWRLAPEFAAGMAAARLAPEAARLVSGRLVALVGLAWVAAALAFASDACVVPGLWLTLAGLLVAGLQGAPPSLARVPVLLPLGDLSYVCYMSFAVIETMQAVVWRRLGAEPVDAPLAYVAAATAGTLGLALLMRRFVERPALRLARRQSPRLASAPASV